VLFAEVSAFGVHKLLSQSRPLGSERFLFVFAVVSEITEITEINQKNGVNCDDF